MDQNKFTIRVYGILRDAAGRILVSDEYEYGQRFTKFPGGGLMWGEGTRDCLLREWMEELKQEIEITAHFYTTDFFLRSAFDEFTQVISIYYIVKPLTPFGVEIATRPFAYLHEVPGAQSLRWVAAGDFSSSVMTFAIDKKVASMLKES